MEVTLNIIEHSAEEAVQAAGKLREPAALAFMESAASLLAETFRASGKLIVAGNGGSLCDAAHFAEELTGQFRKRRAALPAISLCNAGHLTCVANDMGFNEVFSRGVEAYGSAGDVFCALTTSGKSENLRRAVAQAKEQGLKTIAFLGKGGGELKGLCDLEWIVEDFSTSDRIQEAHMAAIHIIIEALEAKLFC